MELKTTIALLGEFFKVWKMSNDSAIAIKVFADGAKGAEGLAASIAGLSASLVSIWPVLVGVGVALAAIAVIDYNTPIKQFERLSETAEGARASLSGTQSEIDSLSAQLDDLYNQISELESIGSLTITEQAQLDLLRQQTAELEAQKKIQENIAAIQIGVAARSSNDVLTSKTFKQQDGAIISTDGYGREYSTNTYHAVDYIDSVRNQYNELLELEAERKKLLEEQANLEPEYSSWWQDDTQYEKNATRLEALDSRIASLSSSVSENVGEINANYAALFDVEGNVLPGYEDTVNRVDELFSYMATSSEAANDKTRLLAESLSSNLQTQARAISQMSPDEMLSKFQRLADGTEKGLDYVSASLKGIVRFAVQNGIIPDDSIDSVRTLIATLSELGYTSGGTVDGVEDLTSSFDTAKSKSDELAKSIASVQSILNAQSTGKTLSLSDYESVKEYGSALEYVNGVYQLNTDKVTALIKAKAQEQLAINNTNKALKQNEYIQNAAQIDELRAKLQSNSFEQGENAEMIRAQIASLREQNAEISNIVTQYNLMNAAIQQSTGEYQNWLNAQNASQTGEMFDSSLSALTKINNTLNNKKSDDYGRIGNADYKAALEFVIPDTVDSSDQAAVQSYLKSLSDILTLDDSGNFDGLNIEAFCKKAVEQGLMVLEGDEFKIAGNKTMQDFADGMNMSLPMIQAIFGEMQEFGGEFDWYDELFTGFDESIYLAEKSIQDLETALDELTEKRENGIEVDDSDIEEAKAKLEEAKRAKEELIHSAMPHITATVDINQRIEEAQRKVDGWRTSLEADPTNVEVQANLQEAESELAALKAEKEELGEPTKLELELAQNTVASEIESIDTELSNLANTDYRAEFNISTEQAENRISVLKTRKEELESQQATLEIYANSSQADSTINTVEQEKIENKTVVINATDNASSTIRNIRDYLSGLPGYKSITIETIRRTTTYNSTVGSPSVNGTAHASGTAKASGDWKVKDGGQKLVGELGREIVVDPYTGKWYTVGDNGPELRNIPKGSIVFNHIQSESILKNGYAIGRGKALLNGTAMVTGGIVVSNANNSSSGTTTTTTSNNRNNSNSNSNSNNNNNNNRNNNNNSSIKKGLDAFKEWFEKLFDWIEVLVSRRTAKIESLIKNAEIKTGNKDYGGAAGSYRSAINETAALSENQRKAYDRYNRQAAVTMYEAVRGGLLDSKTAKTIKQRIANGTININEYSEKVREVIKDYQQWYDKAQKASQAIQDLHANIQKYIKDLKDLRDAQRDATVDRKNTIGGIVSSFFTFTTGAANSQLNYSTSILKSVSSAYATNISNVEADTKSIGKSATGSINARLKEKDAKRNKKYKQALQNAKSAISKKAAISSGDLSTIRKYSLMTYERLYAYNLALQAVEETRLEYETTFAANQATIFENISNKYNNLDNSADNTIELLRKKAANDTSASGKNSQLDKIITQYNNKLTRDDDEISEYASLVDSSKAQIEKNYKGSTFNNLSNQDQANVNAVITQVRDNVNNGTTIPAGTIAKVADYFAKGYLNQSFYESCIQYNNALQHKFEAENQKNIDEATIKAEKAAIGAERVENVQKQYENQLRSGVTNSRNTATSARELKKSRGIDLSAQDYQTQIASYVSEAQIYTNARNAVQQTIQQNLDNGLWTTSSQEYLDAIAALSEYGVKIDEANASIEGLRDALRDDVYWRTFERAHDAAQRLANVLSGINDLIDDDSLFDSDGGLTDFGVARIAMLTKELASARTEVQNYANDIQNLNDLYAQGQYTELEYNEKLGELQTNLLKSASSAKSFTDSIVKMYREMAKSELDAIFKLIEARKSALKAKKDYYDYDKKLKTKSNDIQALEAQLAALQDIDTAEARARTAKLSAELQEKQDDLTELVQDHEFDLSSDAISGLKDTLQETFDDKWEHISGDLNAITELLSASNSLATQSAAGVQSTLNQLLTFYGVNPVTTGISRNYASGTKKVPFNMTALTNENGPEIIVTPNGIITPLPAGSGVVPADLTERLYAMAQNYAPDKKVGKSSFAMPQSGNSETIVNQHYDSMIHIDGSADAATVEDLKKYSQKILDESYKYVSGKVFSGYVRSGGTRRV